MDIDFRLPNEPASPDLHYSLTLAKVRLLADGIELPRKKGGGYVVPLRDGRSRFIFFEFGLDGKPVLQLDTLEKLRLDPSRPGEPTASTLQPAVWWPMLLRVLPIVALLLLGGGVLGAIFGAAGIAVNWRLVRSQSAVVIQVLTAMGVTAACVLAYLLVHIRITGGLHI